jgi:hypothetical protein
MPKYEKAARASFGFQTTLAQEGRRNWIADHPLGTLYCLHTPRSAARIDGG